MWAELNTAGGLWAGGFDERHCLPHCGDVLIITYLCYSLCLFPFLLHPQLLKLSLTLRPRKGPWQLSDQRFIHAIPQLLVTKRSVWHCVGCWGYRNNMILRAF